MKKGLDALTQAVVTGAIVPTNEAQRMELEQTKHTPGGWEVKNRTNVVVGGKQVATTGFKMGGWPRADFEEEAANARLIAAAPELLEACRKAFARLVYLSQDAAADEVEGNEQVSDMLLAAIARAEGGVK